MKDSENSDEQNGHSRVTAGLIKSILKVHPKPPSEKTKVQFSCPSLDREKFRDKHPTLNVIQGGCPSERSLFTPTCGERPASWTEEQDEWAQDKAYKLHTKGHHCDVHNTDFFRCMFRKKSGKRIGNTYQWLDVLRRQRCLFFT